MNDRQYISSPGYPQKVPMILWVKVVLLIAVFAFSCFNAIRALVETWSVQDLYSYGYLVPVFTLVWIWIEKENIRYLPVKPDLTSGMIVLLTGCVMLVLGEVGGTAIVQEFAIIVIITGLVLTLLGRGILLAISLPLAYLVMMIPFLDSLVEKLHWPFQLFAAATAERILSIAHIPIVRMDQYLQLPNASLEVANACSGVRFLMSTMVLSIPLAFITQKSWVQRALLFLLAILISVLTNPLRVTLVAAWAYYGDGDIHGPLHIFQGYVVYVIGMVILFFGAWVLQRMPLLNKKSIQKTAGTGTAGFNDLNKFNLALTASLVVLLGVGAYIHLAKVEPVPLKTSLNELPVTIGEWINASTENDERLFPIPGTDAELVRVYQNASGREVKLQISYFESQRQNKILTYYKLQMLHDKKEELTIPNDTRRAVLVNKSVLRNGSQDTLFLSWYNLNGRIITNRYAAKLKTAFSGLIQKRTNGAVVVVASAGSPDGMETALGDEVSFAQALLPVLDNFIPDANR